MSALRFVSEVFALIGEWARELPHAEFTTGQVVVMVATANAIMLFGLVSITLQQAGAM